MEVPPTNKVAPKAEGVGVGMKRQREDAAVSTAGDALEEVVSPPRASTQSFFAPGSQEQD